MPINQRNKKHNVSTDNSILYLFLIYLFSNLLILLNTSGLYWDDWVLYNQDFKELKDMFNQQTGNIFLLEYLYYFFGIIGNGVFPFRIAVFISYFLSGAFVYFILKDIQFLSKKSAFYIAALFLILPVNSSRFALCVAPYGFFNTIFFFAFWLLTRYMNSQQRVFFRVMVLAFFFISFYVNSLLVFYSIVLLYLLYKIHLTNPFEPFFKQIKILCIKYPDFLCLPVVFWVIKKLVFVPYGLYKNYNSINLKIIQNNLFANIRTTISTAFYQPLVQNIQVSGRYFLLFMLTCILIFVVLYKKNKQSIKDSTSPVQNPTLMIGLGMAFFLLAIFPYNIVGKIPALDNFESRHMLLIPLGMALVVYSLILLLEQKNKTFSGIVFIAVLSSFTLKNNYDQFQYLKDWFYQVSIEEQYKDSHVIKDNSTFVFKSDIPFATKRSMQFYESSGRLRKVFGDAKRFMADNYHEILLYQSYKNYKRYNYSSWELSAPIKVIVTTQPDHPITLAGFLKLLSDMLVNDTLFRSEAKQLTQMHTETMTTEDI